ncbi:hypothetical protein SAMN05421780_11424 [Flexibacter flexilis DSM 6793]|uniref:Uncharacterized protein n=1 Tax=Flexibacter flexilis DSM 6793 TaxID=927664 RepID=A0A1I1NCR4_9BACT|nr:hypothetical protein [Flexibacter flexilis]SFC95514.1 hypothetical protein SAMN05421780_11424 [Flexibacter flexilis DSM 6793]
MSSLKQTPTIPQPKYVISPDQIKTAYRNVFESIDLFNQRCKELKQKIRLNFHHTIKAVIKTYFQLVNAGKVAYGDPIELSSALLAKFARSKRHAAQAYRRRMIELGFISIAENPTPDPDKPQFGKKFQHFNTLWNINLNAFQELLEVTEAVEEFAASTPNNTPSGGNSSPAPVINNECPQAPQVAPDSPQNPENSLRTLFYKMLIFNILQKELGEKIATILRFKICFNSKTYCYNDVDLWISSACAQNNNTKSQILKSVFFGKLKDWGNFKISQGGAARLGGL